MAGERRYSLNFGMPETNLVAEEQAHALALKFAGMFGESPRIYQAPGRVNLIGEHTDYNDGWVMPAAIGFYTWAAIAPRSDRKVVIQSENFSARTEFDLNNLPPTREGQWSDYAIGVAKMLQASEGRLSGANLLIAGNVPQGAGLSSSASMEVAVGYALLQVTGQTINLTQLARLCQQAENEFVGARCGIMDQFIASHGKRDHALLLDCRSLEYRLLPLRGDARLVICNTMMKHNHATGEYNRRRSECEAGVGYIAKHRPGVRALRDASLADLAACRSELPETILRRCRHVIQENLRVLEAAAALEQEDLETFGELMGQSHRSLRDDFEVSCRELDLMVELAVEAKGVYGARMMGGGFGGCTINLVRSDYVESFKLTVREAYEQSTGMKPDIYICTAADGVGQTL
jgi:galactokinase